ncbi:helix-turn-helix domain-containing protein [Pedobacter sp. SYP-B3415]|uniref:winged helix-turn-helix transcriptional regulator n=1 Tax=Pedobacter sp. SYP-B3415 TaxID=2496641 RepID=UPI00101BA8BC|nr:helix-turn-helix domain-containing protein [Pedobacter sp. SYP-B3415]
MYQKKSPELLDCGLAVALKVIGGKWRTWVLDCIIREIRRPSAIQREMQGVSQRVVNLHIHELEAYGLIFKKILRARPAHVEYHLTEAGEKLLPILRDLDNWGNTHKHYLYRDNPAFIPGSCAYSAEDARVDVADQRPAS